MRQYFRFVGAYISYLYHFYQIRRKYGEKVMNELVGRPGLDQQQFTPHQQKRIDLYSYVGLYVNDCLATLRGRKMTGKEIENTLYLSLLTPLLDDLTDNYQLSSAQILEQLDQEGDGHPRQFRLAAYLYNHIRKENKQELFAGTFSEALLSQDDSLQQLGDSGLGAEALFRITCNKGSLWTLLFRLMLDHALKTGEREAVEAFGELIQLTNDMFDVYKDVQNGQQTCFTNTSDIAPLQQNYDHCLEEIVQHFSSLAYEKKHIRKTVGKLLVMGALGKVCLEQLKGCQEGSGGDFTPAAYTRKQLVCDMERWSNRLDYMKMSVQLYDRYLL
ncbi:hypothetical protein C900_02116 [Fulvivirga imtechensis AK7]|uniref:Uncharacterized protein n=1 Tax=Fulvivirga imtechensis AK7 TaxID=1237149 RepID=L8K2N0_9BACT|nr:class 1 isoprenoid biosynthesis enzyme [Fulvivirga imtechensis]ELR73712.1 hypothetical protein C900_02116 [Fulvivirga imtechensis AK7]